MCVCLAVARPYAKTEPTSNDKQRAFHRERRLIEVRVVVEPATHRRRLSTINAPRRWNGTSIQNSILKTEQKKKNLLCEIIQIHYARVALK